MLLAPDQNDLPGFVEHARTRVERLVWSWTTLLWALLPHRFWRRVTVDRRVDLRGMLLWPLLVLAVPYMIWGVTGMGRNYVRWETFGRRWGASHEPWGYVSAWMRPFFGVAWRQGELAGWFNADALLAITPVLAMHGAYLLLMLLLTESRRLAALRTVHPLRAFVYGLTCFAPLLIMLVGSQVVSVSAGLIQILTPRTGAASLSLPTLKILWGAYAIFLAIWVPWWWAVAMVRVWRLSQGWLVWALLTIVALLASATSFIVIGG